MNDKDILPFHYYLTFEPHFLSFKTNGYVYICCIAKCPINRIRLNAKELEILEINVLHNSGKLTLRSIHNPEEEYIDIILNKKVCGIILIGIGFTCYNNDKMYGFYRSYYIENNKKKYILTTHLEPVNARAVFPCFDRPSAKATFEVSMVIDKSMSAISNTEIKSITPISRNKKLIVFHTTPKMSTYLLYLGVGDFIYVQSVVDNLKIRIISVSNNESNIGVTMFIAKKSITLLQDYFRIQYPLAKLDHIAVPDFKEGAMENWGAIAFRQTALLVNSDTETSSIKFIATTIAHEQVHQWFGDLVSMKQWNDIWLNESFAEFISYKIINKIFPEWDLSTQFLLDNIAEAMNTDSLYNIHAISGKIRSDKEIKLIFDKIEYQKGASVLHMFEDYVGQDIFREGLRIYLSKHQYSNTTDSDFWNAIQEAINKSHRKINFIKVAKDWILKPGFPIVHVRKTLQGFILRQERYTISGNISCVWKIPITFLTSNGLYDILMEEEEYIIFDKSEWIKLNFGQSGFYRVSYEEGLLKKIGILIKNNKLNNIDAWGVENDLFAFVRDGSLSIDYYLIFMKSFLTEKGYPVNSSIIDHLHWFYMISYDIEFNYEIKNISVEFHSNLLYKLGWIENVNDNMIDIDLRSSVIQNLGLEGHYQVVNEAKKLFIGLVTEDKQIDVDIRSSIYKVVARNSGENIFNIFIARYLEEEVEDEKVRLLSALGYFKSPTLIQKALEFNGSSNVRLQDSGNILSAISHNPEAHEILWNWVQNRWRKLVDENNTSATEFSSLMKLLVNITDHKIVSQIADFFSHKDDIPKYAEKSVARTLEIIAANMKLIANIILSDE